MNNNNTKSIRHVENRMVKVSPFLSAFILNIRWLPTPQSKVIDYKMDKKQKPWSNQWGLQGNQFKYKDTKRWKVKGQEKIIHANSSKKRAVILTSNKIYWIPKTVTRDKKGTNILIAKK